MRTSVVAGAGGDVLGPAVEQLDVVEVHGGDAGVGAEERVPRQVVAVERRLREGLGHRREGDARAAADVGDLDAPLEGVDDAVEGGDDLGDEGEAGPRAEHALGAVGAARSEPVVGQADAGAEGVGEVVDDRRVERGGEGAGGEAQAVVLVGEDRRAFGEELEGEPVVVAARRPAAALPRSHSSSQRSCSPVAWPRDSAVTAPAPSIER